MSDGLIKPRLFERYLHGLCYGKVYYWYSGDGTKVTPVHFNVATRRIKKRIWNNNGRRREKAAHEKIYKTVKRAIVGPQLDLVKDFKVTERHAFVPLNDRKAIPASRILVDTAECWWKKLVEKA